MHEVRNQNRVAAASIAGYRYQLLHTVRAWLEVQDDELIVAEGNEDIDQICLASNTHVEEQVKHRSTALRQGSRAIRETVLRYLEAFAYHHQNGEHFRGVLRTNAKITARAKTAIGTWILGQKVDVAKFGDELQKLVNKHAPELKGPLSLVLSEEAVTRRFIDSVEWASDSPDVEAVLTKLLATRAPGVDVSLTRAALLERLLRQASSINVAHRTLRRIDADIALTDCALDKLQETATAHERISQAVLWSKAGPPSVAVALLFESAADAKEAVAKQYREERNPSTGDVPRAVRSHGIVRPEAGACRSCRYSPPQEHVAVGRAPMPGWC